MYNTSIKINMPRQVQYILTILKNNNYEAYIVGGCVRDSLLGIKPKDWDITTNALPEAVSKIFKEIDHKVIPTGIKHGTITVVVDKENFEITTYRNKEGFTDALKEDLSKRDFTINAMAYNDNDGLVDYFSGLDHLKKKIIKAVGLPKERYIEDPLRMLRAYRFAAELGFQIEKNTEEDIKALSDNIIKVSIERIREEFNKILLSDNPKEIHKINECGLLKHFIPEFDICEVTNQNNHNHIYSVGEHLIKTVENIEKQLHLRLTMFLHDISKPQCKTMDEKGVGHFYNHNELSSEKAEEILKRMKYDNKTIERVATLIRYHDRVVNSRKSIIKLLSLIGEENFRDILKIKEADIRSQNPNYYEERHSKLLEIDEMLEDIILSKQCFTVADLAIDGNDLIQLGIKEGKLIGEILNTLLAEVIENPHLNNRSSLISIVKTYLR